MCPWFINCLASALDEANPILKTMLSSRDSNRRSRFSPVHSFLLLGKMNIRTELLLQHSVNPPHFLLFSKLCPVVCVFLTALTVLSRRISSPLYGAFIRVAAIPFKEQLGPFPAAEPAH